MGKVLVFLGGAIIGLAIGSTVALLYTPYSGNGLRVEARRRYEESLVAGRQAADERKRQLIAEYEAMKRGEIQVFPN